MGAILFYLVLVAATPLEFSWLWLIIAIIFGVVLA